MNSEILSGIIGFAMPYVVEFLKAKLPATKGKWLGYVLSYGLAVIIGGVSAVVAGSFDTENILSSTGSALIISQGFYNLYFKPNKIDVKIQKVLK